nr:PREDICTED: phosphoinositide 3-kinase regulatory subunit 6 isoform X2 [Struthio camelus australis]
MESTEVESDILRRVRTLLRELDGHHPAFQCDRGMLRWTLHKKIDQNPSNSSILVRILVKELERAERGDYRHYIIPLLHTLMYALIKAPCIPEDLCSRVYDFCKKLLTLPKPFCTIGLDYAVRLKMERTTPGMLYQRMVISEQSLKSDPYPYQEKVFIFADPELLSEAICNALVTDMEAARVFQSPQVCMSYVIIHAMQAVLGEGCDVNGLKGSLQDMPTSDIEHWFRQVVAAVECTGKEGSADRSQHVARLEEIYHAILGAVPADDAPLGKLQGIPLPNPNISFHLWTEDDQLWKELVLFIRPPSQSCESDALSQDLDNFEIQDIISDCECCKQTRFSVLSTDSGIERDLPAAAEESIAPCSTETEQSRLQRKGGIKKKSTLLESVAFLQAGCNSPGVKQVMKPQRRPGITPEPAAPLQRLHTARIVLLGDDRILGRLAQAYHSLRKRETRRVFLTPRLNLQFYYIPVVMGQPNTLAVANCPATGREELCEVAGYLGRADPWYESNINTLCHMIPKLATMPSSPSKHLVTDLFLTDVIAYYVRMGIQPVCFQVYAVKIFFNDPAQEPAEDVFLTELRTSMQDSISQRELAMSKKKTTLDGPGIDLTVMYRKVVVSDRAKEVAISLRSTGLVMKAIPADEAEDLLCLNVNITEIIKSNNLSGRSFSAAANRLKTDNIKIRSTEQRPFMLCLDKDSRRAYRNVIRGYMLCYTEGISMSTELFCEGMDRNG